LFHYNDWVFSFWENFFFYNYKLVSYVFWNYIFNEFTNLNQKIYLNHPGLPKQYELFLSFVVDKMYFLSILSLPYFNEFFKHFLNSSEFNNFFYNHPEFYLLFKDYIFYFYFNYMSNIYISLYLLQFNESYISTTMVFAQVVILFFLVLIFLVTYFTYLVTFTDSDNIIDHDYLVFNAVVESEEEIGSMDDILLTSTILVYIFFWFFWINGFSAFIIAPSNLASSFFLFPFLYFLIVFMPVSLLYDYGSNFLTYLNGVGKSMSLAIESIFDYIAVSIFFLRLIVQNVRLAFMLFTFIELHEMVILNQAWKNIVFLNDSFNNIANGINHLFSSDSFFIVKVFSVRILNWLYEIFHTFFMLIFQFIAFFAMIFWLFLFLYTMFIAEVQEGHFYYKRFYKNKNYRNWFTLKMN